jgi:TorA maturation chaperone TorD
MEKTVITDCERATVYKTLAECYYCPDDALLKLLNDAGKAAADFLSEIIRNAPRADDLERHTVDYSRLFLGPFKLLAPPYGSVYLEDGKFMGESTLAARDLYRQEGLDIVLKDAPDHISAELEFMYFLALKEAEARADADPEQAACLRDRQASFLGDHLGTWVEAFANNIERNARTEFYKAVGRATKDLVLHDLVGLAGIQATSEEG